ncbi:MAG: hypothetical protein AAFY15_00865 [Cyanobacteria bacterium J06648_11]
MASKVSGFVTRIYSALAGQVRSFVMRNVLLVWIALPRYGRSDNEQHEQVRLLALLHLCFAFTGYPVAVWLVVTDSWSSGAQEVSLIAASIAFVYLMWRLVYAMFSDATEQLIVNAHALSEASDMGKERAHAILLIRMLVPLALGLLTIMVAFLIVGRPIFGSAL